MRLASRDRRAWEAERFWEARKKSISFWESFYTNLLNILLCPLQSHNHVPNSEIGHFILLIFQEAQYPETIVYRYKNDASIKEIPSYSLKLIYDHKNVNDFTWPHKSTFVFKNL